MYVVLHPKKGQHFEKRTEIEHKQNALFDQAPFWKANLRFTRHVFSEPRRIQFVSDKDLIRLS